MKPHKYGKRTLKRMSPLQRKVALAVNALEDEARRLRVVVDVLGEVEKDAGAQRKYREELAAFGAEVQGFCIAHGRRADLTNGIQYCTIDVAAGTPEVADAVHA